MASGEFRHKDVVVGTLPEDSYESTVQHILNDAVDGDFIYWDTASGGFKRIAHADDPDAHTYNPYERIATGHYLWSPLFTGADQAQAMVANVLYATPYPIATARTVDRLAVNVTTADVGQVARMGIYADNGSCYPGALVVDCGEFSVGDVELSTNVIDETIGPGLYWIAFLTDGTPTLSRVFDPIIIRDGTGFPSQYGGVGKTGSSYGALSGFDPYPSGATISYRANTALLRFSA